MSLAMRLQELFERYEFDFADFPWVSETDRLAELIFCILNQCSTLAADETRRLVGQLADLGLLQSDKLAELGNPENQVRSVFGYVLNQGGFSDEETESATVSLAKVGEVIQRDYDGKIQRYLRRHAEAIRDELAQTFGTEALAEPKLQYAITHWLQNAFSLPISLQSEAEIEFCRQEGVVIEELYLAADQLGINVAIVDDILEIHQNSEGSRTEPDQEVVV